jgi:N-acetylneuraminic acid mutarotase
MYQQLVIILLLKVFLCNAGNGIIMTTLTGTFLIQPNQVPHVTNVSFGLPNYYRGAAVTLSDGNVYFLGGSNSSSNVATTTVTRFNPFTNTSTPAAPMNIARRNHAATAVNNTIIVCGGTNTGGTATTFCEQSSIGVTSWTNIASLTTVASYHAMVTLNGNAYVMGGQGTLTKVYMYDGATWITQAPLPSPGRYGHGALALDIDRALICGGTISPDVSATCFIYVASTDQYSNVSDMAKTRYEFSLVMSESMVECVVDRT